MRNNVKRYNIDCDWIVRLEARDKNVGLESGEIEFLALLYRQVVHSEILLGGLKLELMQRYWLVKS